MPSVPNHQEKDRRNKPYRRNKYCCDKQEQRGSLIQISESILIAEYSWSLVQVWAKKRGCLKSKLRQPFSIFFLLMGFIHNCQQF
jgi:hypothetical protein